ncbi:hypothetical protein ABZU94_13890 [Streptomyces mirabilis]|uniref:hypothetical protein n=1 Tax=Streptomyces sp. NPDC005388 TaxID=3156717 RepID=UPI0033A263F7
MTANDDEPQRAAAELGVGLPQGFTYLGNGQAMVFGTAEDFRIAGAILDRLNGVPAEDCWPTEPEPDQRPLAELLADWTTKLGEPPLIWNMGYKLRRQLREVLGPDVNGLQRAVALEIADDANDDTRESWASLEDLARWTAAKDTNVVRNALKRLGAAGWEFRVPIGKGKDGRLLYAVPGRRMTFRVPDLEGVAVATPKEERELPQGGAVATPQPGKGEPRLPIGVATAPSEGAPATPFSSIPSEVPSSLSVAEQVVCNSGVVADDERETFINWINNNHNPRGPAWWRTVARNGDLRDLAERWRADQPTQTASKTPAWCGHCGDDNPAARFNPNFRLIDGAPCPDCHPDALRSKTA